jgi:hypothetical protein
MAASQESGGRPTSGGNGPAAMVVLWKRRSAGAFPVPSRWALGLLPGVR